MSTQQQFPNDIDPIETQEWLDALSSVLEKEGPERAHFLLENLVKYTRRRGVHLPFDATTSYINTIAVGKEQKIPGDKEMEHRIKSIIRWNAVAMVLRASNKNLELGGHIASFQSAATLYDVGFNHFFKAPSDKNGGDMVFIQGHSSPGIYARAFVEGRLTEEQMDNFRQEVDGKGLSSYPHPWLMPDFWQFPTVSMGLGPLMGIYQARFLKYLEARGLADVKGRKVWVFCGDGEMDEPESQGAISLAAREGLDNLIFVINCNLQRLDGPVRGNGKIIQELEGNFRGAGWNVLKAIWGSRWDGLLAMDKDNILKQRMNECVDGDYQTFKSKDGAYVREYFFGKYPELKNMVANMTDDEIWGLNRGGHDPQKVYAAYYEAVNNAKGHPTVILAKTIKGYAMGASAEGQNTAHQTKKMDIESLRKFRDRFDIPVTDEELEHPPFYRFADDSPEIQYMQARRKELGGYLPARHPNHDPLPIPELDAFDALLKDGGEREFSTTMALVRIMNTLLKDKNLGKRIVPIVPDESRTFGMEGMFRQYGLWNPKGQTYVPQDADQLMFYKESVDGQILQEGINEPGAMSSWIAAATSYANNNLTMIPFFIYYSMFGFQRVGDLAWAAGDSRARGFMIGGTAGRTTLNGEGLQHEDGHSHIQAGLIPNCVSYDPTYAYEVAVIVQDGLRRMYKEQEDIFYYLTVMNENYKHPALPKGAKIKEAILKGIYCLKEGEKGKLKVQLIGSGVILNEVIAAAEILKTEYKVDADIWSATSFNLLARDGREVERYNRLHPAEATATMVAAPTPAQQADTLKDNIIGTPQKTLLSEQAGSTRVLLSTQTDKQQNARIVEPKMAFVTKQLSGRKGPFIAATDYVRAYAEQIRAYVPGDYVVLGTDGFGRSDSRANLREFFEVNRQHIVVAALNALANQGEIKKEVVAQAIKQFGINTENKPSWKR